MWLWLLVAVAAPVSSLPTRPAAPAVVALQVPAEHAELRSLLLSFHGDQLPSARAVATSGGTPALVWLATHDDLVVVRERALLVLATTDRSEVGGETCRALAQAPQSGRVQAAALYCLHRADLVATPVAQVLFEQALRHDDPRVAVAGVTGLGRTSEGRVKLARWSEQAVMSSVVQETVDRALSPSPQP